MSDEFNDYHALEADYRRRLDEALPTTKAVIFDALAAADICRVVVTFDGSGDSGQIEGATAFGADDAPRELPPIGVEITIPSFWPEPADHRNCALPEAIDCVAWSLLDRTHGGWENDEGGYGEIAFDTTERTITLEMNVRYVECDYHERRFCGAAMAHPWHHAESSARRFGGKPEDYLPVHDWQDGSKLILADFRHRPLRHHAEGCFAAEALLGRTLRNSAGALVPVRLVAERHIVEDLGRIPSFADWARCIRPERWMGTPGGLDAPDP